MQTVPPADSVAGRWEDDGWVQSAADPQRCRVAGPGVTRAIAGQQGELVIEVCHQGGEGGQQQQ